MEEIIVGVVGVLQFDVLKYRLENEYNVEIRLENLPYEHIRWIGTRMRWMWRKLTGNFGYEKSNGSEGKSSAFICECMECGNDSGQESGTAVGRVQQN